MSNMNHASKSDENLMIIFAIALDDVCRSPIGYTEYLTLRSGSQSAREKQERRRVDFPLGLRNISEYNGVQSL